MGDIATTNALLQVLSELKNTAVDLKSTTAALERATFQLHRIANVGENSQALMETEVRDSKLAAERAVECFDKVPPALAVLAVAVQLSATQSIEAKTEARRAADNSRTDIRLPEPNTPRRTHSEDSGKTAAGAARRAWHDFLRAPTRSQAAALILVAILAMALLGFFAIKNGYRAQELEHEGAPIHQSKGP